MYSRNYLVRPLKCLSQRWSICEVYVTSAGLIKKMIAKQMNTSEHLIVSFTVRNRIPDDKSHFRITWVKGK